MSTMQQFLADASSIRQALEKKESKLIAVVENPVDKVWASDRPQRKKNNVFPLDVKYSGNGSILEIEISCLRKL